MFIVCGWLSHRQLAYDWEALEVEEDEPDRPAFKPKIIRPDPITGEPVKVCCCCLSVAPYDQIFPDWLRKVRFSTSIFIILLMVGVVIMVVISIIVYRLAVNLAISKSSDDPNSEAAKNGMYVVCCSSFANGSSRCCHLLHCCHSQLDWYHDSEHYLRQDGREDERLGEPSEAD
jgi:hypothetical protein